MSECEGLSAMMPDVLAGRAAWSAAQEAHLMACAECAAEWRLVGLGATLYSGLVPDTERLVEVVLRGIRSDARLLPLRRLPWRGFALGLAAAASVALAVWVPNRAHETDVVALPSRIGPLLPKLSSLTDEQLDRISLASEGSYGVGEAGAVPHLSDLSESDLTQLSKLTERP